MIAATLPARVSARYVLRESTRVAHERLHGLPDFAALAAGTIGRQGYVALLGRLLGFHAPMEAALAVALVGEQGELAPGAWRRADLLGRDLAYFGVMASGLASLPAISPPLLACRATALGLLYVLEGSTLGGRLLARKLDTLLPSREIDGRRFLSAGTLPGHARWSATCAAIDECGATDEALTTMVAAARESFRQFELWFGANDAT